MIIEFEKQSPAKRYFTMIQTIIPRPVAWVLSENPGGNFNLAPFSYFNGVSSNPPLLMLVVGKKPDGSLKDTRVNIIERSEFVVHIAHREMAPLVTESSRVLEHGDSELQHTGLETVAFDGFRLPRLQDARIAFACSRYKVEDITEEQALIIGQIQQVYVDDSVVDNQDGRLKIRADKVDPIARLGGDDYATFGEIITIPIPR